MKKRGVAILFSAVIFALFFSFSANAEDLPKFDDSSVIVVTKPERSSIGLFSIGESFDDVLAKLGITETKELMDLSSNTSSISLFSASDERIVKLTLPEAGEDKVLEAVNMLNASGTVKYAEPNYYYYLDAMPDDSEYVSEDEAKTYRFHMIDAEAVWETDINCSNVTVAVLDSGIFAEHEDLKDNIWTKPNEIPNNNYDDDDNGYKDDVHGWDFTGSGDNDPDDGYNPEYNMQGHGTHISGIISAVTGNDKGIASLAGNIKTGSAKIVPLKIFFDYNGGKSTRVDMIVAAIDYVKKMNIPIANCSWGGSNNEPLMQAIQSCTDTLFVAAAGNGNNNVGIDMDNAAAYPARYKFDNVISVGASNSDNKLAGFSNYGTSVDIAAPGVNIWSTCNTDLKKDSYKYISGTSQATPLVASMAAVLKGKYPSLTPAEIKDCLKEGATIATNPGNHEVNANRRLNAEGALIRAQSLYCEVKWEDDKGNVIDRTSVQYGSVPSHDPIEKQKDEYEYTFERWEPEPSYVTEDTVYRAVFSKQVAHYTVTWYVDGVSTVEEYTYNDTPVYKGNTPSREETDEYTYVFRGWIPDIEPVTEDAEYIAGFDSETKTYPITWRDEDGSVLAESEAEYGSLPVYPEEAEEPSKEPTDELEYIFDGWSPEPNIVTGPAEYTAKYREKKREYTIIWKNYDGEEIVRENIEYGVTPYYLYETPVRDDTDSTHYTFSGWYPEPVPVTGNAEYTAQFTETQKKYTITWKDENGNIIRTDMAADGEIPKYKGEYNKKPPEGYYVYIPDWDPEITEAVGNAEYTMKYTRADMLETSVMLTDGDGYAVRKGGSAKQINARVEFPNAVKGLSEADAANVEPYTLIAAVYDESCALMGIAEKNVRGNDMLNSVTLTANSDKNKTIGSIKLFMWKTTGSMIPIRNAKDVL